MIRIINDRENVVLTIREAESPVSVRYVLDFHDAMRVREQLEAAIDRVATIMIAEAAGRDYVKDLEAAT